MFNRLSVVSILKKTSGIKTKISHLRIYFTFQYIYILHIVYIYIYIIYLSVKFSYDFTVC